MVLKEHCMVAREGILCNSHKLGVRVSWIEFNLHALHGYLRVTECKSQQLVTNEFVFEISCYSLAQTLASRVLHKHHLRNVF